MCWDGSARSETIHAGYFEHYPSCFTDSNGSPRGIFVDLLDAIAAREKWRVEYHLDTWDANVKKLDRAEIDLLLSMVMSEERLQNYTFSTVTIVNNWAQIFVPADSQIQSLLDLQGKRIATLKSGYHTNSSEGIIAINAKFRLKCQFLFEDEYAGVIDALKQGRADAGVLTHLVGRVYAHDPDIKKTGIVFAPTDARFALPKYGSNTASLVEKLDAHLAAMQNENPSEFYTILETYLGEQRHVVATLPRWLGGFLVVLGSGTFLLATTALFFRWQLRRRTYELRRRIHEQKQVEEALRQNEEWLRKVLEILPVGVWIADKNGTILHGNPTGQLIWAGARYVGPEQFHEYKAWWPGTGKRITPEEWGVNRAIAKGEASCEEEIEIECFDGTHKIILNWAAPIFGHDQRIEGAVAVNQDITERKRAENLLRESELRFRQIYEHMHVGVAQISLDFRVERANQAYCAMLGYNEEELRGKHLRDFTHPDIVAENLQKQTQLARGEIDHYQMEKSFVHKDGHTVYGILGANVIRDAAGKPLYFLGSVLDITERRRAEEALRASEARFRSYIAYAPNGLFIADEQGSYLEVNPAACKITGYTVEELLRMCIADLALPGSLEAAAAHFQQVAQTGQASGEFPFRHKTGEIRYWSVDAVRLSSTRFMGFVQDITDRKHAEAEILRLKAVLEQRVVERTAQLEAANKELERFAYVTSHDLKAPLRGISQLAGWLLTDYADVLDANGQKLCVLLIGRVKRMDALIDGILQYSRIGRISNDPEPTALAEIIVEVLEMLNPPATIRISMPPDLPIVKGDRIRLIQVFQNLLNNALNFMDKSDGRIIIGCKDAGAFWTLSVSDNGQGIPPQYHERIFQIFQTLHARDEYESTGIGLAIVKKIVELHGGTIWVESEPGQGSTFFFTLPKTSEQE